MGHFFFVQAIIFLGHKIKYVIVNTFLNEEKITYVIL